MCKEGLVIVYAGIIATSALSFVKEKRLSLIGGLPCTEFKVIRLEPLALMICFWFAKSSTL